MHVSCFNYIALPVPTAWVAELRSRRPGAVELLVGGWGVRMVHSRPGRLDSWMPSTCGTHTHARHTPHILSLHLSPSLDFPLLLFSLSIRTRPKTRALTLSRDDSPLLTTMPLTPIHNPGSLLTYLYNQPISSNTSCRLSHITQPYGRHASGLFSRHVSF